MTVFYIFFPLEVINRFHRLASKVQAFFVLFDQAWNPPVRGERFWWERAGIIRGVRFIHD
jgi:hypothetical protein